MEEARRSVTQVARAASDAAALVLAVVPRSASAATDEDLLSAVADVAELNRATQTAMAVLAEEVATRSVMVQGSETLATKNGQKDAAGLLQFVGRISQPSAKRFLEMGDAIADRDTLTGAPLPPRWEHLAEAAFEGRIEAEAVVPVVRQLEDVKHRADPDALEAAEEGMARIASTGTPEYARGQMRVWAEALDPDGARPREEAQRRARFFRIGRECTDGMTPVHGLLTPDAAARLRAATSTFTNPRSKPSFLPADEPVLVDGQELPAGVSVQDLDPRSRDQKLHDILDGLVTAGHQAATRGGNVGVIGSSATADDVAISDEKKGGNAADDGSARAASDADETESRDRASGDDENGDANDARPAGGGRRSMTQLIATITLEDLKNGDGVAWVNGMSEPLGPVSVERIVCDQGYRTLIEGENGEVLWLGTKTQMFTPAQKLAIAARDETCDWPGCDIPADWCEVHHVQYRRNDGPTDVDNGILLCSAHHHMAHSYDWDLQMRDGIPYLLPPAFLNRDRTPIRLGRNRTRDVSERRPGRPGGTRDGGRGGRQRGGRDRPGTNRANGTDPPDST